MFGTPIELVDMARDVTQDLSESDKIMLATEIILSVTSDAQLIALQNAHDAIAAHVGLICGLPSSDGGHT